jgi:hypothetical protein
MKLLKKLLFCSFLSTTILMANAQRTALDFNPAKHGFHFPNLFKNQSAALATDGLCGGMTLAAFNYFRYKIPIPPHREEDIDYTVSFDLGLRTISAEPLIEYIFNSQIATFTNISVAAFIGPVDPDYVTEFNKAKARIDRKEFLVLGLKIISGGLGHQVLCYGYDPVGLKLFVYDPNTPDIESVITPSADRKTIIITAKEHVDKRFKAIFEEQELYKDKISDRVTYDAVANVLQNLNYAVRPPLGAMPRIRRSIAGSYVDGSLPSTDLYRFQNSGNQKYVEVDGSPFGGHKVQQYFGYERNGFVDGTNQKWLIIPAGTRNGEKIFYIINYSFLRYLHAKPELTVEDGNTDLDEELWVFQPATGNNQYFIRSLSTGQYVTTIGSLDGGKVNLTGFTGQTNQVFTSIHLAGNTGVRNFNTSESANIKPAYNDGKGIDATGGASANNIQLTLKDLAPGRIDQQWQFIRDAEGYYEIKSLNSGNRKCLEIFGFSMDNGGIAECWDYVNGINQKWLIIPVAREDGKYIFFNKNSGKCLNVSGGNRNENGARLIQYKFMNQENSKWRINIARR